MSQSRSLIALPDNLPPAVKADIEAEYAKSMAEAFEKLPPILERIQIAPAGANVYQFGEGKEPRQSFKGVIIGYSPAFAYWHDADAVKNPILLDLPEEHNYKVPLCSSLDGLHGSRPMEMVAVEERAEECFGLCVDPNDPKRERPKCFLNHFATAMRDGKRGKGKACKNGIRLIVMVEGNRLPYILSFTPSSIAPFRSYKAKLMGAGVFEWMVWTYFGLSLRENGKERWSVFTPGKPESLTPEEVADIYQLRKQFIPAIQTEITEADFATAETEEDTTVI